jgi:hypothetical protein
MIYRQATILIMICGIVFVVVGYDWRFIPLVAFGCAVLFSVGFLVGSEDLWLGERLHARTQRDTSSS